MQKIEFKILSLIVSLVLSTQLATLANVEVTLMPKNKITTSNTNYAVGDTVEFTVVDDVFVNNKLLLKKGTTVEGLTTCVEPNGWSGEIAKLTIEQLVTKDVNGKRIKLVGAVYKAGNSPDSYLEAFPSWLFYGLDILFSWAVRGGEVHLKPEKDKFNVFVKENL